MEEKTTKISFEESAQRVTDTVLERSRRILVSALGPGFKGKTPGEINAAICDLMLASVKKMSNNV